jgi:predicted transcriptional regulator
MKRLRDEARELRRQGLSVGEIAKRTGASRSSVSLWVRDIELTNEQRAVLRDNQRKWAGQNLGAQVNRVKAREARLKWQAEGRMRAKECHPLHMAGCMLYWAEGAKDRTKMYFVNSDANMLRMFMRFLREEMHVPDSEIVMYIHCHTTETQIIEQIQSYWLNTLNLPASCLRKTIYKRGNPDVRHNILENGVCTIRVYRVDLIQHIYGAIQEYGGFENPDWLF